MLRNALLCLGLGCLLGSASAAEPAEGWTRLRAGMSPAETAAILGRPLLRNAGKGFELWIYSGGAEVLFHRGPVMAWTAPTRVSTPPPSGTVVYSHDVFFLPGHQAPARGSNAGRRSGSSVGYSLQEILRYRGR